MDYLLVSIAFFSVYCFGMFNIMLYLYLRVRTAGLNGKVKTMVVLGSGGHTAEMLKLITNMDMTKYTPRVYVVAETDSHSEQKAIKFEKEVQNGDECTPSIVRIPRSREVGQSYITSFLTTCYSLIFSLYAVLVHRPVVIIINGPGTCIPIVAASVLFRSLGWITGKVIYMESIARVKKLSLTGKILYQLGWVDDFEVMWECLNQRFKATHFGGRLY